MSKNKKVTLIIVAAVAAFVVLVIGAYAVFAAWWNGAFNFMFPREIATYQSPDGEYTLVFEQLGQPDFPFGPADVRLTLKNEKGRRVDRVSTSIYEDGANASEYNIQSISWGEDGVTVILKASEMKNKRVVLLYR